MEMYSYTEINLVCTGDYQRKTNDYFDKSFGNWLPGDPESVSDFKIFLENDDGSRLEVTKYITEIEHDRLLEQFYEECRNQLLGGSDE